MWEFVCVLMLYNFHLPCSLCRLCKGWLSLPPSRTLSSRACIFWMTYWKSLPLPVHNGFLSSPVKSPNPISSYGAIYFYPKTQLSKFAKENTGHYGKTFKRRLLEESVMKVKTYKKRKKAMCFLCICLKRSFLPWLETKWTLETTVSFLIEILCVSVNKGKVLEFLFKGQCEH